MKVMHLTVSGDLVGGGDTIIANILSEKRKDVNECLATLFYSDFMNELSLKQNIKYYHSEKYQRDGSFITYGRFWAIEVVIKKIFFIYNLSKIIKKEKIDIIHAHGFPSGLAAIIVRFFCKIKIVYTHHFFKTKMSPFEHLLLYNFYKTFDANTAVSKTVCKSLNDIFPNLKPKFEVVYNCVAASFFTNNTKSENLFDIYKKKGRKIFVQAARFHAIKNQMLVTEAVNKLSLKFRKKILVVFLGEGEEKNKVELYVKQNKLDDNFIFMGAVKSDDVLSIMSECDYGLFPSELEGFGLGAVECMALGLPVLALNNQLMLEIVGDGGILTDKQNLDKAFIEMINIGETLKDKARDQASNFTPTKMKDGYFSIYRRILITN